MRVPAARVTIPEQDKPRIFADFEEVLRSGRLTLGPFTEQFEQAYASMIRVDHAIAVNSGTSALEIIFRSLGVAGRKVVIPTNTFFATPAAAIHAGARVVLVDVDYSLMLDASMLERIIDRDTAAIVVVHIGGYVHPEIGRIREISEKHDIPLIEDAAHAHGSQLNGDFAGTLGLAAAFSFYPTKVLTTGEGGMITTNDEKLAKDARILRDQGKANFNTNFHTKLGYNWRMGELNAALGIHQLKRLPEFLSCRRRTAKIYTNGLHSMPGVVQSGIVASSNPNFYKFVVVLKKDRSRSEIKQKLKSDFEISLSGEVYDIPCHLQPVFMDLESVSHGPLLQSEDLCSRHICLPMYSDMTEAEANYVLHALKAVLT